MTWKLLVLTAVSLLTLASCRRQPPAVTVRVTAAANPIVSGKPTTITATVKRGNEPAYSTTVNFSASGCGTVSPSSATTPSDSSAGNSDASVKDNDLIPWGAHISFTGNSLLSTCLGTITATADGVSEFCKVTVTPRPVTQPVVQGGTASPVVTITPAMTAVATGSEWTYKVDAPAGYYISSIDIELEAQADIRASNFVGEKPDPPVSVTHALFAVWRPLAPEGGREPVLVNSDTVSSDTVTVQTTSAKVGVATIDVVVHNPSRRGQILHVLFKGLPGPK
ncbi:MAG: hypothetical protein ACLQOO_28835 [Terriglobia bacterium]